MLALFVLATAVAAYPLLLTPKWEAFAYTGAILAALWIVAFATTSRIFSWIATAALVIHYAVGLSLSDRSVDLASPLVALALFLILELIDLRFLLSRGGTVEKEAISHRLRFMFLMSTIGCAVSALVLFAGVIVQTRTPPYVLVAALVAAGLLLAIVYLAGEATRDDSA